MLIATNGVYRTAWRNSRSLEIVAFFPICDGSETIGKRTRPCFFYRRDGSVRLFDPAKVLMIGDLWEADIAGAAAAGLKTCWFNPSGLPRPADSVAGPDVPGLEIRTLGELLTRLGG
jgi:FMN phosphatase YigB (HAD superfamily)